MVGNWVEERVIYILKKTFLLSTIHPVFPSGYIVIIVQYQNLETVEHFCSVKFVQMSCNTSFIYGTFQFKKVFPVILFHLTFHNNLFSAFCG